MKVTDCLLDIVQAQMIKKVVESTTFVGSTLLFLVFKHAAVRNSSILV